MLRSLGIEGFETGYSVSEFFDAKLGYAKLAKQFIQKNRVCCNSFERTGRKSATIRKLTGRAAAVLVNEFNQ